MWVLSLQYPPDLTTGTYFYRKTLLLCPILKDGEKPRQSQSQEGLKMFQGNA